MGITAFGRRIRATASMLLTCTAIAAVAPSGALAQWQCSWRASADAEDAARKALDKKKYGKAIAEASKAIKLSPTNVSVYNIRGQAYFEKGNYDKAIADFTKAIDTDIATECIPSHIANDYDRVEDAMTAYRASILTANYTMRAKVYEKRKQHRAGRGNTPGADADGELLRIDQEKLTSMSKETLPESRSGMAEKRRQAHEQAKAEWAAIEEAERMAKSEAEQARQEQERISQKQESARQEQELAIQEQSQQTLKELENDYFVPVEGGTFTMGCTKDQGSDCGNDEKPAHKVTVSAFYMGKYELTQKLWRAVMRNNPSKFVGDSLPVEQVSFEDVQEFIAELNKMTGQNYRLPTEAEWEFAARGGNASGNNRYSGSNVVGDVAWYIGNNGSFGTDAFRTKPVGGKKANELGLYDMSGNVFEWVSDLYGNYAPSAATDPTGPPSGPNRVYRGGSCGENAESCRVSKRRDSTPENHSFDLGFRLVFSPF